MGVVREGFPEEVTWWLIELKQGAREPRAREEHTTTRDRLEQRPRSQKELGSLEE